jgi:FKBP-type peptidyl-prolyl cis-trans isomerase (trigger factor)
LSGSLGYTRSPAARGAAAPGILLPAPSGAPVQPQQSSAMDVTEAVEDGLLRSYRVRLPAAQVLALRDRRLAEIAGTVPMPGFRPGEAPWPAVLQRYGASVLSEVIEQQVAEAAARLIAERGLTPAQPPRIAVESFAEDRGLLFRVTFEALPAISLPELPRLSLERLRAEPGEAEVAAALAALAAEHGTFEEVAPRPAAPGDTLLCDVVGRLPPDLLPNGPGRGAQAGMPGLPPTTWTLDCSAGLVREILSTGAEDGRPFFDLALRGTAQAGGHLRVFFAPAEAVRAGPGEAMSVCVHARAIAGALPAGASLRLGFNERSAAGLLRASRATVAFGAAELRASLRLCDDPALAHARPLLEIAFAAAAPVDLVLRIGPARVFGGAEEPDAPVFPGGTFQRLDVPVGGEAIAPGFTRQLVGITPGETRELDLVYPAEHPAPELAGQRARFAVTALAIRQRRPRPVDDALARSLGHADRAALEAAVLARLRRDCDARARALLRRAVLDALASIARFAVPSGLVEAEFRRIWSRRDAERRAGREAPGETGRPEAALRAEYRALAERRVRLRLLLAEIARAGGLTVSEEELARAIRREAARHPGQEDRVLDHFRRTPAAVDALRAPLLEQKVVELMLARAAVTERLVSPAELLRG